MKNKKTILVFITLINIFSFQLLAQKKFEFVNLLIHSFLEKITHHNPILMLLGLVAIAALLVPLHHKVEHWATAKLEKKNK